MGRVEGLDALSGVETSPITGPEGNVEFLLGAIKEDEDDRATRDDRGLWRKALVDGAADRRRRLG